MLHGTSVVVWHVQVQVDVHVKLKCVCVEVAEGKPCVWTFV